ncbi:hypothetical protein [Mesorhizobium sp. B4-1-1]|uniref:hypothetical protein n=1 Tax=Mesorhizobium sp. B4-1-1 TaxID=2589890 RepID=UPI001128C191|nr:hypothetical protein [Mesorhizobium sp. B4-1-1]TPI11717.1 hypothetical protein FJW10_28260 [Mesorhizobium sp. B4-1-1]
MPALAPMPALSDYRLAIVRYLIDNVDNPSISILEVIRAVRKAFPLCEMTDWELGNQIARAAIDAGFGVEFDAEVP